MAFTTDSSTGTDTLRQSIRNSGLKVTAPRLAVLEVLQQNPHSSAEQIFAKAQDILGGSSTQAVYGILAAFTGAGLARRFDPPGSAALFECRVGDNHHHLVCAQCGVVKDVDCVIGQAPCLTPSDTAGFTVFAAEVTFNGLCQPCRVQATAEPTS
ncbi:Fur family transcriptional regulator [Arthrobacter sp. H41]|uniref:Fur family transcriptional regulator n=1 Tax=Arthrobacter sp. H41 TaxID=1312978 RepID=UPI0004B49BA0|nr:Fur family transcriptional regulator [Arthrobacter sp. H41]